MKACSYNYVIALGNKEKVPRKIKKFILGRKISSSKLRNLLKEVEIIDHASTMHEDPIIKPFSFCPHCGCTGMIGTGNMSSYPEHWERFHCLRCHKIVGYIDNSPFIHALECKEENYNPIF